MATLKDVAEYAQVSQATVSRVIRGGQGVSIASETRERVLKALEHLNYQIRPRRNNDGHAGTPRIGIVAFRNEHAESTDPYYLSIRQSIEQEIHAQGGSVSIQWRDAIKSYANFMNFDAVIVIGGNGEAEQYFMDREIRVLFLDGSPNPERYDSIVVDFERGTEKALKHLTALGHARIGYIGGYRPEDPRELAYRKYMGMAGGFEDRLLRASGDWSIHSGYELMNALIAERCLPTALYVASDPMALGAMRALLEGGLRVPEDIAIVSCNDNELARFTNPPLTTVHVPTQAMGSIAVNMLVGGVIREHCPLQVTVPTKLVIRESCGAKNIGKQGRNDG